MDALLAELEKAPISAEGRSRLANMINGLPWDDIFWDNIDIFVLELNKKNLALARNPKSASFIIIQQPDSE